MTSRLGPLAGLALGPLLSLAGMVVLAEVPDQFLLGAYTILVLLVAASVTISAKAGFTLALLAVTSETVTDLVYFVWLENVDLSLLPYAVGFVFFVGRIPLFLLAGVLGGYLSQYFAEEKPKEKRVRVKVRKGQLHR